MHPMLRAPTMCRGYYFLNKHFKGSFPRLGDLVLIDCQNTITILCVASELGERRCEYEYYCLYSFTSVLRLGGLDRSTLYTVAHTNVPRKYRPWCKLSGVPGVAASPIDSPRGSDEVSNILMYLPRGYLPRFIGAHVFTQFHDLATTQPPRRIFTQLPRSTQERT